jgi:hypothetical protein
MRTSSRTRTGWAAKSTATPSLRAPASWNTPWTFEERLAEAKKIKDGPGLLVFCGNGVRWQRSNLEDFADYYHARKHRQDDPFAQMEKHHIETEGLKLLHNVDNFGVIRRPMEQARMRDFVYPVRGPAFGGVIK